MGDGKEARPTDAIVTQPRQAQVKVSIPRREGSLVTTLLFRTLASRRGTTGFGHSGQAHLIYKCRSRPCLRSFHIPRSLCLSTTRLVGFPQLTRGTENYSSSANSTPRSPRLTVPEFTLPCSSDSPADLLISFPMTTTIPLPMSRCSFPSGPRCPLRSRGRS